MIWCLSCVCGASLVPTPCLPVAGSEVFGLSRLYMQYPYYAYCLHHLTHGCLHALQWMLVVGKWVAGVAKTKRLVESGWAEDMDVSGWAPSVWLLVVAKTEST